MISGCVEADERSPFLIYLDNIKSGTCTEKLIYACICDCVYVVCAKKHTFLFWGGERHISTDGYFVLFLESLTQEEPNNTVTHPRLVYKQLLTE
jgi:hypothetical protein